MHKYRTHTCNELDINNIGEEVKLSGWISYKRNHGDLLFIDLRDHYGVTQCVIEGNILQNKDKISKFASINYESVISIIGIVKQREKGTINNKLSTGHVEVTIEELEVLSLASSLPFQVRQQESQTPENLRLKYRFLDLRTEIMQKNIKLRSDVIFFIRSLLIENGFHEIQTPILTSSSPEGARDFIVPSRLNKGKFYALPQAPQQFKQILMTAGFDKYFQIAPCFRDEDARADRSPGEFYQLDLEMSFVTQEDIFNLIGNVIYKLFNEFSQKSINYHPEEGFPQITYKDAINNYGTDKPDLRNPLIIENVTEFFENSNFSIFVNAIKKGSVVKAIPAPNTAEKSRKFFDSAIDFAIQNGAGGLAYITYTKDGEIKSPISKFLREEDLESIKKLCSLENGDSVFFLCDTVPKIHSIAGVIRTYLGNQLQLIDENCYKFCWIIDFPFYEIDESTGKIDFAHNPFSMPQGGLDALNNTPDLMSILAYQYDIVCNGIELSSGAIRNHDLSIIYKAFEVVGYDKESVNDHFGGMIKAFSYGAPPHGGIAPGIDRMIMLLADVHNIREVIAFPMNGSGQDLMMDAPSIISEDSLKELSIKVLPQEIQKKQSIN